MADRILDRDGLVLAKDVFENVSGGYGIMLEVTENTAVIARLSTKDDSPLDIYGWLSNDPNRADYAPQIMQHGEVNHVDILADATYYTNAQLFGQPVFFSQSLGRMSLSKGTDGILIGTVHERQLVYSDQIDWEKHGNRTCTANYEFNRRGETDPTTLDLDLTLQLDDETNPSKVGDLRLVVCGTEGAWSDDETLTVQGGGSTLATLDQGSAVIYELKTAVQNTVDQTWTVTWEARTDLPYFHANVNLHSDYFRAQAAKLGDEKEDVVTSLVASTQGQKQPWTVATSAPSGTESDADGWLTFGGLQTNEIFLVKAKESDETDADPRLLQMLATLENYSLCDGNCIMAVGPKGIRVNQIATGAQGYTVDTTVWRVTV